MKIKATYVFNFSEVIEQQHISSSYIMAVVTRSAR